ncbi:MAG: tetratricopeptide repeat protein [Verrucomicrobiota bacterium]
MDEKPIPQNNPFDEPRIVTDPEELFESYKYQILMGAAVIVIAVLGGIGWWISKQNHETNAQTALQQAENIEGWTSVAEEFANTSAGGFAQLKLAEAHKDADNWEGVENAFNTFLQYHKKSPLAPTAELGLARALEVQQKYDAALDAYHQIIASAEKHPFSAPAHIGLARTYQALGQPEAARQILADLIVSTSASAFMSEAEAMLKKLN